MNKLIVILGPTASGKTGLSIKLAKERNGEIISTDSRQIYKGMEIGTAAVTPEEQQGIPHYMLGITTPDKTLTLAEFKKMASQIIADIHARGKTPILIGGTGLYIDSIIYDYDIPKIPPNPKLRAELEAKSTQELHQQLKDLDPEAAAVIHPNNRRFVIRAIEINLESGKNKRPIKRSSPYDLELIGIEWPRPQLYKRIEDRVEQQIEKGLIEEVKNLLDQGYDEKLPSMSSLGVKEIIPYIRGEQSLEEAKDILKLNTRRYAKRQMTWFRRYDNVSWLSPDEL